MVIVKIAGMLTEEVAELTLLTRSQRRETQPDFLSSSFSSSFFLPVKGIQRQGMDCGEIVVLTVTDQTYFPGLFQLSNFIDQTTQSFPADIEQLSHRGWGLAEKNKDLSLCLASFCFPAFNRF